MSLLSQTSSLNNCSQTDEIINNSSQLASANFDVNESNKITSNVDSVNTCLQFLYKYSPLNSICFQNKNINPKFLNSMLKLIDKYHVPLKLPVSRAEVLTVKEEKDDKSKDLNEKKKNTYKKFSEEEDFLLKNIVNVFGPKNWRLISSMIPNKTPRQCRDRYMNYLAPGFIHSDWTNDEDKLLAEKYVEIGPQWSKIQRFFPSRTANSIKNRFNYTVCRKKHLFNSKDSYKKDSEGNNINDQVIENVFDQIQENVNEDVIDFGYQNCIYDSCEYNENDFNLNFLNY